MPQDINGVTYTGFIDEDRAKLLVAPNQPDDWIPWLEFRLRLVLIHPLDELFDDSSPAHTAVNRSDATFWLCAMTLLTCAVEALGGYVTNQQGRFRNKKRFAAWLGNYMRAWATDTSVVGDPVDWLWTKVRNGLAHALAFKQGGLDEARFPTRFRAGGSRDPQMNVHLFYTDFKTGATEFFGDLRNTRDAALRSRFSAFFHDELLQV